MAFSVNVSGAGDGAEPIAATTAGVTKSCGGLRVDGLEGSGVLVLTN
jgi:hypothetical protein